MAYTGYNASGGEYQIGTERGMNFVSSAPAGSQITGSDGSKWIKNADGSVSISRGDESWNVASPLHNLQNTLDLITQTADRNTARSIEIAQENREWNLQQANAMNSFNAAEAAKNRDWQEYMSNTAHQREVADLKAAGLNPVLSAMNGNGAAVTSGATASANMPDSSNAEVDRSGNAAIVQILSSMLAAETQIANTAVNARAQEAVADKYTAMSYLTAQIAAGVSQYGYDMQYRIQQDFPNTWMRVIDSVLNEAGTSWYKFGSDILDRIKNSDLYKALFPEKIPGSGRSFEPNGGQKKPQKEK